MAVLGTTRFEARLPARQARHGLAVLLCAASFALSALVGCGGSGTAPDGAEPRAVVPAVEAVPARSGALPLEERLNGIVKAENQVAVGAEIEAPIVEVAVRSGESVERGQVIVRLDDRTLRDQLHQAEAAVRLAEGTRSEARARISELEATVVRSRALVEEGLVSALDLDVQEAQLAGAQASAERAAALVEEARALVEERRSAVEKALVRSPVAGRVGQRNAEVGMLAAPGTTLFVVGGLDELIVEVPLTEAMLGYIRAGQPVRIAAPVLDGEPLNATLSRISPFLAAGSFSTIGEIDVANPSALLHPGMFVTVDVLYGESQRATLVPVSALWEDPATGARGVYVVAGSLARQDDAAAPSLSAVPHDVAFRPVELLAEGREMLGVRGVAAGEWVVTVGQHLLAERAAPSARVRQTTWERVLGLQRLQREDLLRGFLDKQQRLARAGGAEPPSTAEFLAGPAGAQQNPSVTGAGAPGGR